ncbi:TetR/AcrR family transcriptional regulator [Mycobacteroides abscessus]|uniref:TetR/AcrR family transcriptional regulator n=1 Tax=Mycobacteroides abscessus TaxID=36809 RepID=UPI00031E9B38|nr:TetR/AcrR family transcriptional regulator [Mycobacteroides abscessus]ORA29401.1 TetR family transcriptional regulator [Mycobacteroides abscessus subsp. bolletii]TPF65562.1 TetR family transcriptional regulator [Mycobacteroides abscessus subsp. bolletii]BBB40410.1 putative transcriptional regulator, TetR family protein [Mycobacteroides abscessus subsp. bolletii BD]
MDKHQLHPRKQPRQRRSEDTRDRILEAAVEVFTHYGYSRGTTNRIAQWADISVGSLYQYYPNKDAIVVELAARHLDDGMTAVKERHRVETPKSAEGLVRLIVAAAIDNHRHDPQFLRVLVEQAPRSTELLARAAEFRRAAVDDMRLLLDRCDDVNVTNKDVAAQLVVTTVELVVHHTLAASEAIAIADFANELVAMLTRYLTASNAKNM